MAKTGIKICAVEAGSLGDQLGMMQGDSILAINGHDIPDELALRFHLAAEQVSLELRKVDGSEEVLELDPHDGTSLGIEVEDFRTRTCNNACLFCFIDQLPPDSRPSLRVKDDDYRLSFLHGNYITLTNLPEKELDRIIEQRLTPLYVSVHATDPDLRTRMLGRKKTDDLQRKITKLIQGGIQLNTQIVLMPEINDGKNLERSISDLFSYYPGVHSVAIVPLGLSKYGFPQERYAPVTAHYCREVIRQVTPWQLDIRRKIQRTFAYLADEFYILGEVPLPETAYYDDFAQIEDGVGMTRQFLNDFEIQIKRRRRSLSKLRGTLVTAALFFPFLSECIERLNARFGSHLNVVEICNEFMGKNITVAGLLSGRDITNTLRGRDLGEFVVIPDEAVSRTDGILVDNLLIADIARDLGKPVYTSGRTVGDFFTLLYKTL